jgi:RNA 2',3'-cyclic 3'-phosphodiesterase
MKRLFFAIPVIAGQELLTIIDYLQFELRSEQINWVTKENLHFTLQFLGDTDENRIPGIIESVKEITGGFSKISGKLKGIGYFSQNGSPRVLFSHIEDLPAMADMAQKIHAAIEIHGFLPDNREFRPHLTLARIKSLRNRPHFYRVTESLRKKSIQSFTAEEIVLFESVLRPGGPVYNPFERFKLS